MRELIQHLGTYAGELIITGIAILIRSIEKKIVIKRNLKKWEAGETYSKIKND